MLIDVIAVNNESLYETYNQFINQLFVDLERMEGNIYDYQKTLPQRSTSVKDREDWSQKELSAEFNHIHEQVLLVGKHIQLLYALWTALDREEQSHLKAINR